MSTQAETIRCAIYTRKSHEEGLDQEFNSLDAQRQAAQSFIDSQRHEGWRCLPQRYDDGACSGGTLERPALQSLLRDIEAGHIDCIVVYKVDRLSRSLLDFARLIGLFDTHGVSFVSVTQQFNTTTSMGRLTLNILLSFAQFEREIIGERIRDKKLATVKQGKFVGGYPVLGLDVVDKKYVVNPEEAKLVRSMFDLYVELGTCRAVAERLNAEGHTTKRFVNRKGKVCGGNEWTQNKVYRVLRDVKYIGKVSHKKDIYEGEHEGFIPPGLFEKVRNLLKDATILGAKPRKYNRALLRKMMTCGHCGRLIRPTYARHGEKRWDYYICGRRMERGYGTCPLPSLPGAQIEKVVTDQLRALLRHPDVIAKTWCEVKRQGGEGADVELDRVGEALRRIDPLWEMLFVAERERIVRLLIERIVVTTSGLDIRFRTNGIERVVEELRPGSHTN